MSVYPYQFQLNKLQYCGNRDLSRLINLLTGHSTWSNRGFSVLVVLGASTICGCNQRHHSRQMATFLTIHPPDLGGDNEQDLRVLSQTRG